MILCHSWSSSSVSGVIPWAFPITPAQLTAPSSFPYLVRIDEIQDSTFSRDVTSSLATVKGTARDEKCASAASREDGTMSPIQTVAPREEMSLAVASPIPLAPPVMAMIFPCNDMFLVLYKWTGVGPKGHLTLNLNQELRKL